MALSRLLQTQRLNQKVFESLWHDAQSYFCHQAIDY